MQLRGWILATLAGGALLLGTWAAPPASANADLVAALDIIDQKPPAPAVNTALVYTNTSGDDVEVKMAATNHDGRSLGTHALKVPARGVRFVFVSEFIDPADLPFVGWVEAKATRRIHGTAVLVGLGATDLPSQPRPHSRMIFPVTAAY